MRRSLHPKDYDDEEDVLGDVDDPELDIPGGGETEVIRASRRGSRKTRAGESFDPEEVEKQQKERNEVKEAQAPATTVAAVSGWFKGVGDFIKTKAAAATAQTTEEPEEDEEEDRERRRARRERRKKRREAREVGMATDAEATNVEGRTKRRGEDTDVETEVEEKPRKPSRRHKEDSSSSPVEDRSSRSRRTKEDLPASPLEEPPRLRHEDKSRPSSPVEERSCRRQDPPSPTESRSTRSTRREEFTSPIDDRSSRRSRSRQEARSTLAAEEEPTSPSSPPVRLPIRQRALSISASVDAGLRGLRDSVANAITDRVEATSAQVEADKKEQEQRTLKSEGRASRSGRRRGGETDGEEEPSRRHGEEEDRSRRRRGADATTDVEDEKPSSRSRRRAPSVAVTDEEESDASTRSQRRRKQRSDSEGDTPAHQLAKANASGEFGFLVPLQC